MDNRIPAFRLRSFPLPGPPTIRKLCQEHGISMQELAQESHLSALVIWDVFTGNERDSDVLVKLLSAINGLTLRDYTMEDIVA